MRQLAQNTPLFIESFANGCEALRDNSDDFYAPDAGIINKILAKHNIGFEIRGDSLISRELDGNAIAVSVVTYTLEENAKTIIGKSLDRSEALLAEGRPREAVQEVLWLLETVSTAFRGVETESGQVEGKYFNHIVRDLRAHHRGTTLDRILEWVTTMHGYLSSPKGGGVRHGMDLREGISLDINEARLFCNLTRSYISFLLSELKSI